MEVKAVGVIGAGQMGGGVAQVCIQSGFKVILRDIEDAQLEKALTLMEKNLSSQVTKGKLTEQNKSEILSRLTPTVELFLVKECDVVIEAVPEDEGLKKKVFSELDQICLPHTILASNTSSIPITKMGAATKRPDKVIGMHFMNPAPVMKLVEIIRAYFTSDETYGIVKKLAKDLGKEVVTAKDFPGFLGARIGMSFLNEAAYALYEGAGTVEDIDKSIKLGLNHPMGPLELMDFIGIDTVYSVLKTLYEGYGNLKYFPCALFSQMIQAGCLGRKTGRGFYDYTKNKS